MPAINTQAKFAGEGDAFVDALVVACQAPRASLEKPCMPELIGRELTPYFGVDEELPPLLRGKQAPAGRSPTNNKRKSSPPHQARPQSGSQPSSPSSMAPSSKHGKKASAPVDIASPSCLAPAQRASSVATPSQRTNIKGALRSRSETSSPAPSGRNSLSGSPVSSGAIYACPGMFSSPKPEALPMPTSGILMRAAGVSNFGRGNMANACALVMA